MIYRLTVDTAHRPAMPAKDLLMKIRDFLRLQGHTADLVSDPTRLTKKVVEVNPDSLRGPDAYQDITLVFTGSTPYSHTHVFSEEAEDDETEYHFPRCWGHIEKATVVHGRGVTTTHYEVRISRKIIPN